MLDIRVQTRIIKAAETLTSDNVPVGCEAVVFMRVEDPERAALHVENYSEAVFQAANSALKDTVGNMELTDIDNSKNEKSSIRAMVDKYNDNPTLKQVISTALDDFSSVAELGYLMADAQRYAAKADIALVNPGGVRLHYLAKGSITMMNVYQLDPFGNELVLTKLTGNEIHALMLAAYPIDENLPVYPSGIKTKLKLDANGKTFEALWSPPVRGRGLKHQPPGRLRWNRSVASRAGAWIETRSWR